MCVLMWHLYPAKNKKNIVISAIGSRVSVPWKSSLIYIFYYFVTCTYWYILGNITKKLPRRTVVPVSDTVIFCVELEHPCPDAYWTRNGEKLKENSRISIACMLRQYTLTIRDCQVDDTGEVAFVAGDCKTSTRFSVTGEDDISV